MESTANSGVASAASARVSVVIPTRNRPELVRRAVESVLAQTYRDFEIIVVIDGPDAMTEAALGEFTDPRLRLLALAESQGGSDARNAGIAAAKGEWVAFLDDDDEWLPEKLARQLAHSAARPERPVFLASRFIERSELGDRILPRRSLACREPFSEFLFCRPNLSAGTGYVQTSTWLVSRPLIEAVRFTSKLKRNQDVDWMLRAMAVKDATLAIVPEPLVIFHESGKTGRVSKKADWRFQFDWLERNRELFTGNAYSFFVATVCIEDAVRARAGMRAYTALLRAFLLRGRPTLRSGFFFAYYAFYPERMRVTRRARASAVSRIGEIAMS
ncbi:MAG TPA: glycosyltransferase family 2 protein [Acidobacteriaceae bacterium]